MDIKPKPLNITIIASDDAMTKNLQQVFSGNASADQFIYMNQIGRASCRERVSSPV